MLQRRIRSAIAQAAECPVVLLKLAGECMFSRGTADSPLQQFPSGSQLHSAFLDEFDKLWKLSEGGSSRPPARNPE